MLLYPNPTDPIEGPIYAVEVVDADTSAKVRFGKGREPVAVFLGEVFESERGWNRVELTAGKATLRVFGAPLDIMRPTAGPSIAGPGSSGVTQVAGPDAAGAAPTGNPVATIGSEITSAAGALNALNAALSVAVKGKRFVSISWPAAGNNLIGTLKAEASFDGGTTYAPNYSHRAYFLSLYGAGFGTLPNAPFRSETIGLLGAGFSAAFVIEVPAGASHIRVRVSAYTSGTSPATTQLRATDQGPNWVRSHRGTEPILSQLGAVAASFPTAQVDISAWETIEVFLNVTTLSAANNLLVQSVDENGDAYTLATLSVAAVAKLTALIGKGGSTNAPLGRLLQLALSGGTPVLNYSVYGR